MSTETLIKAFDTMALVAKTLTYPPEIGVSDKDREAVESVLRDTALRLRNNVPIPTRHSDDIAIDLFAEKMKAKMKDARENKGREGWDDPSKCSVGYLRLLLYEHLQKGDPRDVAILCMMLEHYGSHTIMKSPLETTKIL